MSLHNNFQIKNQKALRRLLLLKPYDGWSIEDYTSATTNKKLFMLKRRNVPLYKKGFEFIYHDENNTNNIIGISSFIGDTNDSLFCRGIVLVDSNGFVVREGKEIQLSIKKRMDDKSSATTSTTMNRKSVILNKETIKNTNNCNTTTPATRPGPGSVLPNIMEEQTSELAKLGLILIGGLTFLRIISTLFFSVYVVFLPLLILYAMSTCPQNDTFDAKKELKRVLRGYHLPENHPDKPKNDWLSSTIARVTASVATELATSLGYQLSFFNVFGICNFVTVDIPVLHQELYWIGIFGSWRYLLKREKEKPE